MYNNRQISQSIETTTVAQQKLDLLQFSSGRVAEFRTGPPEVVWRQRRDSDLLCLFCHSFSPEVPLSNRVLDL
jgi:hypothetical protein